MTSEQFMLTTDSRLLFVYNFLRVKGQTQRSHCCSQSYTLSHTARPWETPPNNTFWKTASACHEITASANLRGDYHLTISLLSLIPLLGVNCLTYDREGRLSVMPVCSVFYVSVAWGNDRGMGWRGQINEWEVGGGFRVWFRNLCYFIFCFCVFCSVSIASFTLKLCYAHALGTFFCYISFINAQKESYPYF